MDWGDRDELRETEREHGKLEEIERLENVETHESLYRKA